MTATEAVDLLEANIKKVKLDFETTVIFQQMFAGIRKEIEKEEADIEKDKDGTTD